MRQATFCQRELMSSHVSAPPTDESATHRAAEEVGRLENTRTAPRPISVDVDLENRKLPAFNCQAAKTFQPWSWYAIGNARAIAEFCVRHVGYR
jgi:hypothetical protein